MTMRALSQATLQQPQQQQLPAPVLRFEEACQPPPATGREAEQRRPGMVPSSDVGPADSHARVAAAMDFGWEASVADMDVVLQQGIDFTMAMETHVRSPAELQRHQQVGFAMVLGIAVNPQMLLWSVSWQHYRVWGRCAVRGSAAW
jgi:hypothetical protein